MLPNEILDMIFYNVSPLEEYFYAVVCRDWYFYFRARREARLESIWFTSVRYAVATVPRLLWAQSYGCPCDGITSAIIAIEKNWQVFEDVVINKRLCPWNVHSETRLATSKNREIFNIVCDRYAVHDLLSTPQPVIGFPSNPRIADAAAECNDIETLEWLRDRGCSWDKGTFTSAIKGGSIYTCLFLIERMCPYDMRVACEIAAVKNNLQLLKWLLGRHDCVWDVRTLIAAASKGHMEIIQHLEKTCKLWDERWDERICSAAARSYNLQLLKYLRKIRCPWDARTCSAAAEGGHMEVLQWAEANSCKWDETTCLSAAKGGHLDILKYLREKKCPWNIQTKWYAHISGNEELLQWVKDNGWPDWSATIPRRARETLL